MSISKNLALGVAVAAAAVALAAPTAAAKPGTTFDPSPPKLPALIVSNATFNSAGPGAVNVYMEAQVYRGGAPTCTATFNTGGGTTFQLYNQGATYGRTEYYNQFSRPGSYTATVECRNDQGFDSRTFSLQVR